MDTYNGNRKSQQRYLHITCDHFFVVVVAAYETTTRTSTNGIAAVERDKKSRAAPDEAAPIKYPT